jgi:glycosyltransferase involved in cell wall biosynthesis
VSASPLRIAQLSRTPSRLDGGIYFALAGLLPALASEMGTTGALRAFGSRDVHSDEDQARWSPVPTTTFHSWPPASFAYAPALGAALRAFQPHVMHIHGMWSHAALASLQVSRRNHIPYIVSPHGMLDPWALRFSSWKKKIAAALFQRRQLERATVLHALSASEAQAFREFGLTNPIVIIPNGVDLPVIDPLTIASTDGNSDRPHTLLFIGRIHPKKGLAALIEAWIPFSAKGQPGESWRLVIAGWNEIGHEEVLRAQTRAGSADDRITFAGPLWGEAKVAALRRADAFILPSLSEGLPMSVLEAWAYAKPALITPACNLAEGVTAGAALSITPDAAGISIGLHQLTGLPVDRLHQMGISARRLAEAKFAWPQIAATMHRLYTGVANGETPPADLLAPSP